MRSASRPRGNTVPGRLRLLDRWLLAAEGPLLVGEGFLGAPAADVGLGALPWTTVEWARALRQRDPGLRVLGIDRDPSRVSAARALFGEELEWREGDLAPGEPCRLIRAMNLLRQVPAAEVPGALARLGAALVPGGLLIEGSSSHSGHVLAARTLRRGPDGLRPESLVFATDFTDGFAPAMFRGPLPQGLRLPWSAENPAFEVLERWSEARRGLTERGGIEGEFAASALAAGGRIIGGAAVFSLVVPQDESSALHAAI